LVKSSIQKITDISSKKSPTLCHPTLIQGPIFIGDPQQDLNLSPKNLKFVFFIEHTNWSHDLKKIQIPFLGARGHQTHLRPLKCTIS
jgi:hypothetical protein